MDTRAVPTRVKALSSWMISNNAVTASRLVAARFSAVGAHRSHYALLAALDEFGPASQASLGRRIGLDRSDVAALTATLVEGGFIGRGPDPTDRRRNTVTITDSGLAYLDKLDALAVAAQEDFLAPLSAPERERLTELLMTLVEHHGDG